MPFHRLAALVAITLPVLCPGVASALAPAGAASTDLDAFLKAQPVPGARDRAFLVLAPALAARLGFDPAVVRTVDPGLVCNPSSRITNEFQATLGRLGQLQTICTPDGGNLGVLTLADGTSYMTVCGKPAGVRIQADLAVGDRSFHGSNEAPARPPAPANDCAGWTKQPR